MRPEVIERIITEVTERIWERLHLQATSVNFLFLGKKPANVSTKMLEAFLATEKSEPIVIACGFSWTSLMRCSQMMPQTEEEQQLMQALLEGKRVHIIKENKSYFLPKFKPNYSVREKIKEMENSLQSYGVNFIHLSALLQLDAKIDSELIIKDGQRYVTEKQLQKMKLQQNTTLVLPYNCRLTDMARAFINAKAIKVKYDERK